jgi:hypothetical protein
MMCRADLGMVAKREVPAHCESNSVHPALVIGLIQNVYGDRSDKEMESRNGGRGTGLCEVIEKEGGG